MTMQAQKAQLKLMISFMLVANTTELNHTRQKLVAIMKNAQKKVVPVWIAAKTKNAAKKMVQTKWIAVKMVNALKKGITERIAVKNHDLFLN